MVFTPEMRNECNRKHAERRRLERITRTEIVWVVALVVLLAVVAVHS